MFYLFCTSGIVGLGSSYAITYHVTTTLHFQIELHYQETAVLEEI